MLAESKRSPSATDHEHLVAAAALGKALAEAVVGVGVGLRLEMVTEAGCSHDSRLFKLRVAMQAAQLARASSAAFCV